jgi:hypothetical protein
MHRRNDAFKVSVRISVKNKDGVRSLSLSVQIILNLISEKQDMIMVTQFDQPRIGG